MAFCPAGVLGLIERVGGMLRPPRKAAGAFTDGAAT